MRAQTCDNYVEDSQNESGFANGDINIYDIYADVCFAGRATDEARQFLKVHAGQALALVSAVRSPLQFYACMQFGHPAHHAFHSQSSSLAWEGHGTV